MRTLRLALVGTLLLVLLGGMGGVVLAEDETVVETPVVVTGLDTCSLLVEGACRYVDGVQRCRGQVASCNDRMSDPRVTGTFRNTLNSDCFEGRSGCLYWGTHVLDGPDGGWDCTWSGLADPYPDSGNDGLVYAVCPGTGAYEGLTYTWYHVFAFGLPRGPNSSFGDGTDMHGLIYGDELASLTPPVVVEE